MFGDGRIAARGLNTLTVPAQTYQKQFHHDFGQLHDPHVRALAWMLTSPELLAFNAVQWNGKIARLSLPASTLHTWLSELDHDPGVLHNALNLQRQRRLGHYAENLLRFYLQRDGRLFAHNVQVHDAHKKTLGEFDFLLREPGGFLHWELATKFYLFSAAFEGANSENRFDFLGPNLADSLGAKMGKIFSQQLKLSEHAASRAMLTQAVIAAQALIKGWLFYRARDYASPPQLEGIAYNHCAGWWWTLTEFNQKMEAQIGFYASILPRLAWLAPAQCAYHEVLNFDQLVAEVRRLLENDNSPLMVAIMAPNDLKMQEMTRGMVVPDDWPQRAASLKRG